MPRKNIYVKDEDVTLFDKAEELGGDSISAVIAEALKKYIEVKEAESMGMEEYTLIVGFTSERNNDTKKVRFTGRKLAEGTCYSGSTSDGRDRGTTYEIYETKAGKVVIFADNWSNWQGEASTSGYVVLDKLPGYDDCIDFGGSVPYATIPGNILREAYEALGQELVEYIE